DALVTAAGAAGTEVAYLKPHGALYHRVVRDAEHAEAVVALAREARLAVVGLPGGLVLDLARAAGLPTLGEAFADRGYRADGSLVPRTEPGAVLHDPTAVAQRMLGLVRDGTVTASDGSSVRVAAGTICVHSDTPGAVAIARALREDLVAAGVEIAAPASACGCCRAGSGRSSSSSTRPPPHAPSPSGCASDPTPRTSCPAPAPCSSSPRTRRHCPACASSWRRRERPTPCRCPRRRSSSRSTTTARTWPRSPTSPG